MRASDSDREAVVEELRRHHAEGRLAVDELQERVGTAYQAKTVGELASVVGDLPAPPPPPPTFATRVRPYLWYGLAAAGVAGLVGGLVAGGVTNHFAFPAGLIWVGFFWLRGPIWGRRRRGGRWGGSRLGGGQGPGPSSGAGWGG